MESIVHRLERIQQLLEKLCELLMRHFAQEAEQPLREEDVLADRADIQWVESIK